MPAARADVNDMTGGQKIKGVGKALGREGILKVAQAQANIWFDAEAWLKQSGGHIDREPNVASRLAIQKALLPIEPANATAMNTQNSSSKDGTVGIMHDAADRGGLSSLGQRRHSSASYQEPKGRHARNHKITHFNFLFNEGLDQNKDFVRFYPRSQYQLTNFYSPDE